MTESRWSLAYVSTGVQKIWNMIVWYNDFSSTRLGSWHTSAEYSNSSVLHKSFKQGLEQHAAKWQVQVCIRAPWLWNCLGTYVSAPFGALNGSQFLVCSCRWNMWWLELLHCQPCSSNVQKYWNSAGILWSKKDTRLHVEWTAFGINQFVIAQYDNGQCRRRRHAWTLHRVEKRLAMLCVTRKVYEKLCCWFWLGFPFTAAVHTYKIQLHSL